MEIANKSKNYNGLIWGLSVAIPVVVAVLLFLPEKTELGAFDTMVLPHINAALNSITSVLLIIGGIMIKRGNQIAHRNAMISAFILSSIFLISYVLYHATQPSTSFGGEGLIKTVYFIILISHILLAAIVVPFVLFALYFALTKQFERHKKVTKWAFPIWLYVAITGVVVYAMISPYYA